MLRILQILALTSISIVAGCIVDSSNENKKPQFVDHIPIASEYDNLDSAIAHSSNVITLLLQGHEGQDWYGIPQAVFEMNNLEKLTISMDSIHSIPDEIERLTKLKELNLPYDAIVHVSPAIGNLDSLEVLNLFANFIENLPPTICNLRNLKELNLFSNYLKSLPECICEMQNLEILVISYLPNQEHIDSSEYQRIKTCLPNCAIVYREVD